MASAIGPVKMGSLAAFGSVTAPGSVTAHGAAAMDGAALGGAAMEGAALVSPRGRMPLYALECPCMPFLYRCVYILQTTEYAIHNPHRV